MWIEAFFISLMNPSPKPLNLSNIRKVWILGAGYFGRRALTAVHACLENLSERALVVDRDPRRLKGLDAEVVCAEAVQWLGDHQGAPDGPHEGEDHLIVPALPLHVAAGWLKARIGGHGGRERSPVPDELLRELPNPHPFPEGGGLYTSIATWRCPEDCPAPASHCTHTQAPREPDLYHALGRLRIEGWQTLVVHSRQVAPGVGGYTARQLGDVLAAAQPAGKGLMVATACRCHGVLDLLSPWA